MRNYSVFLSRVIPFVNFLTLLGLLLISLEVLLHLINLGSPPGLLALVKMVKERISPVPLFSFLITVDIVTGGDPRVTS